MARYEGFFVAFEGVLSAGMGWVGEGTRGYWVKEMGKQNVFWDRFFKSEKVYGSMIKLEEQSKALKQIFLRFSNFYIF